MTGHRRLHVILLAAMLCGCASSTMVLPSPPSVLPDNDKTIVPGSRIGNLVIGMSDKQVYQLLGDPQTTADAPRGFSYLYQSMQLNTYEASQQVEEIGTSDPDYVTPEGVHAGGTMLSLRSNYGEPDEIIPGPEWSIYCYEKLGLYAWLNQGAKITSIGVFRPGNYCWGTSR
ncbi:MAG TPA: hypothetical protein VLV87_09065 [Gammaproteobacteria bacterium]|nr:hypothetical protein [Gammaproteobacteria bacterium]